MRVLIVEDEPLIAAFVQEALLDAGHQVTGRARSEETALEMASLDPPDLALVDFHLASGRSGAHVASVLRRLYGTLVIFVSGDPDACRQEAIATGALGCLHKPFEEEDLVASVAIVQAIKDHRLPHSPPKGLQLYSYVV